MIDYNLMKLLHRHGDEWATLERVEEATAGSHHAAADHDPERSPRAWARVFRCTTCAEEFAIGTGDAPEGTASDT